MILLIIFEQILYKIINMNIKKYIYLIFIEFPWKQHGTKAFTTPLTALPIELIRLCCSPNKNTCSIKQT